VIICIFFEKSAVSPYNTLILVANYKVVQNSITRWCSLKITKWRITLAKESFAEQKMLEIVLFYVLGWKSLTYFSMENYF